MIKKEEITRIKAWMKNKPMPPYQIEIKPTNKCNLRCVTCEAMGDLKYNKNEELTLDIYKKLIEEAAEIKVKNIHLSGGGDPLCSDITPNLMKYIKQKGMEGTVSTNGTLFTENIIKELVTIEWDCIAFSLDGVDAETNDIIKGMRGAFEKTISNIKLINKYKKELKKDHPHIELRPVLNRYNYNRIEEYLKLAKVLNAKEIYVQPLRVKNHDAGGQLMLSDKQKTDFSKSIPNILQTAKRIGMNINLDSFDDLLVEKDSDVKEVIKSYTEKKTESTGETVEDEKNKEADITSLPCYHPWFFISIRPNGDVYPCSVDLPEPFGNIKTDSIKDIWFSKQFNRLREGFIKKNIPDYCSLCCGLNLLRTKNIQERLNED